MRTHFRQHGFEPWRYGLLDHDTTSSATHVVTDSPIYSEGEQAVEGNGEEGDLAEGDQGEQYWDQLQCPGFAPDPETMDPGKTNLSAPVPNIEPAAKIIEHQQQYEPESYIHCLTIHQNARIRWLG